MSLAATVAPRMTEGQVRYALGFGQGHSLLGPTGPWMGQRRYWLREVGRGGKLGLAVHGGWAKARASWRGS
jgi:hypothetical protein